MLERLAPAALAAMLLGLTVTGTVPAEAQTTTEAAAEKPAAAAVQPASPAATPPATPASEAAPAPAPAPTPAVAEPPPPPPVDPLLAEIRRQLAEPPRGNVERADRTALTTYYAASEAPFLWVAKDGFTPRARHAMAEIAKADDWGLTASAFELPQLPQGEASAAVLAAAEIKLGLAVLKYARHARGGRLDPAALSKHLDMKPTLREPKAVLDAVAATDTPGDYLRALHPRHQQFQRLRQALLKARGGGSAARPSEPASADPTAVRLPDGPQLKLGSEHPHVALLRQRLGVPASRGAEKIFDLELQDALKTFQGRNNIQASGLLTPRTRAALNGGVPNDKPQAKPVLAGSEAQRLIANMERWRWMPEELGETHIWDNIPEFIARVYKKGQVIHTAKIIVGKPNTPTAVFSSPMKFLVFHPEWGVPDSIKLKEIAPYLSGGGGFFFFGNDTSILTRQRMRVVYNGRPVDPSSVNWGSVDVRRFSFIQSPGPHNVLGVVKFMFPNKHDIYMHDTPQRELFEQQVRLFSHGCIRVHNPGRLAELLLAEDKGWPAEQVRGLLAQGNNNEVQLQRQIPVHVSYFTAVAGEDGHVNYFSDVYGHDNRVLAALGGRPLPADLGPGDEYREASRQPQRKYKQTSNDFFSGLFGN
ncbi:MAG: murein L,D-transpeptidase [Hyphomicrobiaceae bacterium]|jgi:murein L,D-transpeptidase YcbB/YkuD